MSTQVLDQVTSTSSLSADQQARAAAFAESELQHASAAAAVSQVGHGGTGTTTYSISITDNGGGFAKISWIVSDTLGTYCIQQYDWVGVFTNANQALKNPNSNYLGGASGWTVASVGDSFTTDVALQAGMVAAYIIKAANNVYMPVAVSAPFPG